VVRVCHNCSGEFDVEYVGRGRPRAYCYTCQPPNTRMVKGKNAYRVPSPQTPKALKVCQ
jgi:hypothetical protein